MSSDWLATPRATRHTTARHAIPTGDHHNLTEHDAPSPLIDHIVMERLINGEPTAAKTTERYAAAHYLHHQQPHLPLAQIARSVGSSRRSVERWNANHWPNRWHTAPIWKEPTAMDWRHRAACRGEDPELFFPIGNSGAALDQLEEAKAVCRRCNVQEQCLQWALETGQDVGVWGGMSEDERRVMVRRAARARTVRNREARICPQDIKVLTAHADGNTPDEIAALLGTSRKCVIEHLRIARKVLGVTGNDQLTAAARDAELLDHEGAAA